MVFAHVGRQAREEHIENEYLRCVDDYEVKVEDSHSEVVDICGYLRRRIV